MTSVREPDRLNVISIPLCAPPDPPSHPAQQQLLHCSPVAALPALLPSAFLFCGSSNSSPLNTPSSAGNPSKAKGHSYQGRLSVNLPLYFCSSRLSPFSCIPGSRAQHLLQSPFLLHAQWNTQISSSLSSPNFSLSQLLVSVGTPCEHISRTGQGNR